LMAIVNILSIIGLSHVAFALLHDYQKQQKEGTNPVFKPEHFEINLFGISAWGANKYKNSDK
uniref:alanine:cation symporter family protein n=1 Tax=Staphylococcus aureus TaxID=1280 RepID=UPI0035210B33